MYRTFTGQPDDQALIRRCSMVKESREVDGVNGKRKNKNKNKNRDPITSLLLIIVYMMSSECSRGFRNHQNLIISSEETILLRFHPDNK